MHRSIVPIALAIASGCIAPPLRASAGVGGGLGNVTTTDPSLLTYPHSSAGLGEVRAAFTPLALADMPPRSLDVGVGAAIDRIQPTSGVRAKENIAVPFVEAAWFVHTQADHRQGWRFGPTFALEVPLDRRLQMGGDVDGNVGVGVTAGILAEVIERVDGPIMFGGARGWFAIGVSLRAGARAVGGGEYGFVLASLEIRIPGVVALPLPAPSPRLSY